MKIENKWDQLLESEYNKDYYHTLEAFLDEEYHKYNIFPKRENIFNTLRITDYDHVKVVIIGQDPYHNVNQAHGIGFSVQDGVKIPPSLKNIFLELKSDLNVEIPQSGNLTKWAKQGVLLLNAILTVRENEPLSHKGKGWELFTNQIISLINQKTTPVVFILWGNDAKKNLKLITNNHHLILQGTHPSPLSSHHGFFGGKYFSRSNQFLVNNHIEPIDWDLTK